MTGPRLMRADPAELILAEVRRTCHVVAALDLKDARNQYERAQWLGMRDMARMVLGVTYLEGDDNGL